MKICIVARTIEKGDGQGRVNYEIVLEAIHCGYDVTLLADSIAPEFRQSNKIHWITIPVNTWPTQLISNWIFSWKSAAWLKQHRHEFDIVQVNGATTSAPADVNAVHFVHSAWVKSPAHTSRQRQDLYGLYQLLYSNLNAYWERQAFKQANVIVAVSEKVKHELIDIGVPEGQIQVILNGVDLEEFSPGVRGRYTWQLPEDIPLALFVGDLRSNRKNLETILHALIKVPNLHLVVVGNTNGSVYPSLAATLGLSQRVHFLGYRRDVADIMRTANLFVFPSRYEACTLVLLEAMASGLPVITTITAGGSEIVTPSCGVVLPDSEDIELLAETLSIFCHNSAHMQRMGMAARTVAAQHSWSNQAQQYIRLFEELCHKSKQSAIP